ncbi:g9797 [Coccomyxa viridis]|uniref:G9797 protein n=1 Tax=Coccomyxa viridis TaxID=1274662 RepID=A0ABP1G6H9_9CHLO
MVVAHSALLQGSLAISCSHSRVYRAAHSLRQSCRLPASRCTGRRGRQASQIVNAESPSIQSPQTLSPELKSALEKFVQQHNVVLFMKGTKQFPQCGFSNTCVQILQTLNVPFESVNILEDEQLRSGMKEFSQWPTFPQVYINGEFYGGCDIMIEGYQSGELVETLEAALNS